MELVNVICTICSLDCFRAKIRVTRPAPAHDVAVLRSTFSATWLHRHRPAPQRLRQKSKSDPDPCACMRSRVALFHPVLTESLIHANKTYINLTQPSIARQASHGIVSPARQRGFHRHLHISHSDRFGNELDV